MSDVARHAGVAVPTVSRVVNGSEAVSPETTRRVLAAIDELGYRPNAAARSFSRGRVHAVALLVPFVTHPSAVARVQGAVAGLRETDYPISLFDVEEPAHIRQHVAALTGPQRPEGVISISIQWSRDQLDLFERANVPLVAIDSQVESVGCVVGDDCGGGHLATRHLLELGHRRIGFVGDLEDRFGFTSSSSRLEGHRRALAAAGVATDGELVRRGPHGRADAARMGDDLLDRPDPPTAVFVASDTQAVGVIDAARRRGLRVPRDLSVVGYDDVDVADIVGLTTVAQQLEASGRHGVRLLLDRMAGVADEPVRVVLPPRLVIRATTAPPRA